MKLIVEPAISEKIHKMKQRVRWLHPQIVGQGIDQTSLVIDDGEEDNPDFSFMVMGDTGTTSLYGYHPQRKVAELMLPHKEESRFILHTGDVMYAVGSHEFYDTNFIQPYREFLVGGHQPEKIAYDRMTFNLPFLAVPGNHDYYNVPLIYRLFTGTSRPLRRLMRYKDIEIGWHSSNTGEAYAQAFLDYTVGKYNPKELQNHLDQHYTAIIEAGRCLRYQPGKFTRLPNRYYSFRYGGIDFFALDSNTFNTPSPLPDTTEGEINRRQLQQHHRQIEQEEKQILAQCEQLHPQKPDDAEQLNYLQAKLEQIEEVKIDIEKQLTSNATNIVDFEQLNWLKNRLIESWHNSAVRGRIIYFHHPPYVTEATKWNQAQTLAVRHRLRWVLEQVAKTFNSPNQQRPLVDLILNGHAHCLEHIRIGDTGYADSHINCIIAGGSGHYPRRQRPEGNQLMEALPNHSYHQVAESLLFLGRNGRKPHKHLPYTCVRIDVKAGTPPQFIVTPIVADRIGEQWHYPQLPPFCI
jgi:3',5'-cyclic AMP phosphodiesterase CpdA